jgi:hypothetical protein
MPLRCVRVATSSTQPCIARYRRPHDNSPVALIVRSTHIASHYGLTVGASRPQTFPGPRWPSCGLVSSAAAYMGTLQHSTFSYLYERMSASLCVVQPTTICPVPVRHPLLSSGSVTIFSTTSAVQPAVPTRTRQPARPPPWPLPTPSPAAGARRTARCSKHLRLPRLAGNLPPGIPDRDVEDAFAKYGRLRNTWVARKPPGFGFGEHSRFFGCWWNGDGGKQTAHQAQAL